MNCMKFEETIWEYLLGDVATSEKISMDEHFYNCDDCKKKLEEKRQFKMLVEEAIRDRRFQLSDESFTEDVTTKLRYRKDKRYWIGIKKELNPKRIVGSLAIIIIFTCIFILTYKTNEIENWVNKNNDLKAIYGAKETSASSEETEIKNFNKWVNVAVSRHIDLGDSEQIIENLKNKKDLWISVLHSDKDLISFAAGSYILNYEIGKGYTRAVDLSKSGVEALSDRTQKYISPNGNYIVAKDIAHSKVCIVDVKKSTITEIGMRLGDSTIVWSENEKYFAINNIFQDKNNAANATMAAFGGRIDDNGLVSIVSFNENYVRAIDDKGFFPLSGVKLAKIDLTEEQEVDLTKVIGGGYNRILGYYFAKGKNFVFISIPKKNETTNYVCEIKGKEAKVVKEFIGENITVYDEKGRYILSSYNSSKEDNLCICMNGSNIIEEKIKVDGSFYDKGWPSPNFYSYIDSKDQSKIVVRKTSDNSIIASVNIPLEQAIVTYLDCDNILVMNKKLSDNGLNMIKINARTKKIEKLK